MFTSLLSQIKSRIRSTITALATKAVIIAFAALVLLFALSFGLVAAYHALLAFAGLTPLAAAGLVGASLLALALLVLGVLPFVGRRPKKEALDVVAAPSEALSTIDQGLALSVRRIGALPVILTAFAMGFLASRR